MTTESRNERAARLRPLVQQEVGLFKSERQAAEDIGVSNTALNKFLKKGESPYDPTLDVYEQWLRRRQAERRAAAKLAGKAYEPADEVIFEVTGLEGMNPQDRVVEAYRRALQRSPSRTMLAEIDGWRDEYLELPPHDSGDEPA